MSKKVLGLLALSSIMGVLLIGGGFYISNIQYQLSALQAVVNSKQFGPASNLKVQETATQTNQLSQDQWATSSPSFQDGLTDDASEYSFTCSDYNSYEGGMTGFCQDATSGTIISNKNYPGDSNVDGKNRQAVVYFTKLIAADKVLASEYQKAIKLFDDRIKEYGTGSSSDSFGASTYVVTLKQTLPMLVESEKSWMLSRDKDCAIRVNVESPITWGTADMAYFDTLDCKLNSIENRIVFLKEISSYLSPDFGGKY
jgi:uncharacterized protein YecT (DUF1311 family)